MRKLIVGAMISIDGVMQAPGGPREDVSDGFAYGGWVAPHADEISGAWLGDVFRAPFDLLLGRKTYDIFAGYWPEHEDMEIGRRFGEVTKYVVTHDTEFSSDWRNTHVIAGDAVAGINALKAGDGAPLLTQGSAMLLKTLFAHDLVDEMFTLTYPVVLGAGKRLFDANATAGGWSLVATAHSPSGVVMSRYARDGEVKTGSFD
ncbi:dihydrofolate reductase family protein [Pelagibacterium xiamenense]|uniref:dihydrofolate reductase family protein n=1 Tax=Pelagibacterium xiamenense TaxID=2901140 RepID=UPI001E57ED9F|nr:dihydrofolate reductase family protein [Pelagibacterium xiamenense]MCD7058759.1 dihydrofolate reductase family protein [Pelagibacterium xiamenense]